MKQSVDSTSGQAFDPFAMLSESQREALESYENQLQRFNPKINLISPDTEPHIRERHLLHSLALTWRAFPPGSRVIDWGTGGGLPAIPLAIAFPKIDVFAVDSVGKKAKAVRTMARRLGLDNLFAWDGRAENWTGSAHYSVSRATAPLADLWHWHTRIADPDVSRSDGGVWAPGLICLKGGDLSNEIADLQAENPDLVVERHLLQPLLGRDYFAEKYIVTVQKSAG